MHAAEAEGYSATIHAELRIGEHSLALSEVGPQHCVLRSPELVPQGRGAILISVDGEVQETSVEVLGAGDAAGELRLIQLID